jgi:hypothetical protein
MSADVFFGAFTCKQAINFQDKHFALPAVAGYFAVALLLTACGGGGGSSTPTTDTVAPAATVVFPPDNAFTDATTLTITGTATDSSSISAVQVNGVDATTSDGFATWQAVLPPGRRLYHWPPVRTPLPSPLPTAHKTATAAQHRWASTRAMC